MCFKKDGLGRRHWKLIWHNWRSFVGGEVRRHAMMDHMIGGGMMLGMGLFGLLVIVVLILAAAALVKYLFFSKSR